jgi:hypothetical protein
MLPAGALFLQRIRGAGGVAESLREILLLLLLFRYSFGERGIPAANP